MVIMPERLRILLKEIISYPKQADIMHVQGGILAQVGGVLMAEDCSIF
jgi:hypothetical protein